MSNVNDLSSLLSRTTVAKKLPTTNLEPQAVTMVTVQLDYVNQMTRAVTKDVTAPFLSAYVLIEGRVYRSLKTGIVRKACNITFFGQDLETDDAGNLALDESGIPIPTGGIKFKISLSAVRFQNDGEVGPVRLQARRDETTGQSHGVPLTPNLSEKLQKTFWNIDWDVQPEGLQNDILMAITTNPELMEWVPIMIAGQSEEAPTSDPEKGNAPALPAVEEVAGAIDHDPYAKA